MIQTEKKAENIEPYYDLDDDWSLIVASFQSQYGIRLSRELVGMSWREFSYMLNGITGDTPLGNIVRIRAENDPNAIKEFTPEEKRIRNEYRRKMARQKPQKEVTSVIEQFRQAFINMAK